MSFPRRVQPRILFCLPACPAQRAAQSQDEQSLRSDAAPAGGVGQSPIRVVFARLAASSGKAPGWNFHKYLVSSKGEVQSFDSAVEPLSPKLVAAIQSALKP